MHVEFELDRTINCIDITILNFKKGDKSFG